MAIWLGEAGLKAMAELDFEHGFVVNFMQAKTADVRSSLAKKIYNEATVKIQFGPYLNPASPNK